MTPQDRVQALADLLRRCRGALLDFDGPVTVLFPNSSSQAVADAMRDLLCRELPEPVATTKDPLQLLRWAQLHAPSALAPLETLCARGELDAAEKSSLTPGITEALRALHRHGYPVAIVSNNDHRAIRAFLTRHRLERYVDHVCARRPTRPDLMKPSTFLVEEGWRSIAAHPGECVMIGDSVTDIEVCRATGVQSVGWAKTALRGRELHAAGAQVVVGSIGEISSALAT